jgi:hypothetical protein
MPTIAQISAEWIDDKLAGMRHAGQNMQIEPALAIEAFGTIENARRMLAKRHHSFRVIRLDGGVLCLIKRARISRNRWL